MVGNWMEEWMGKQLENGWVTAGKWMGNRWEMEVDSLEVHGNWWGMGGKWLVNGWEVNG